MKLLLFGGSFDPPHLGHVSLLQHAVQAVQPDKVLVVPSHTPPHKAGSTTPPALRLAMCECFLPLHPAVEISDIEIRRGGTSYTLDTVLALQKQWPEASVYLCIGSDMLCSFTGWHEWKQLLLAVTLVVQNRTDTDIPLTKAAAETLCRQGGRVLFTEGTVCPMASSDLRRAIAEGRDVYSEIPPPADAIVRDNGLYRQTDTKALIEKTKALAAEKLGKKRLHHVACVAAEARALAERFGEDADRAELAAWLHDIVKEEDEAALLQRLEGDAKLAEATRLRPFAIWHGPCAAVFARQELNVQDAELLDALVCHTTGRAGMTKLDMILYLADKISAERCYEGVEEIRDMARRDLAGAVRMALQRSVEYTREKGHTLDGETLAALQWLDDGGEAL